MAKLCSWCGAAIPDSLRYSPEESAAILREEAEAKTSRDAAEKERDTKEAKKVIAEIACEVAGFEILKAYKKHTE